MTIRKLVRMAKWQPYPISAHWFPYKHGWILSLKKEKKKKGENIKEPGCSVIVQYKAVTLGVRSHLMSCEISEVVSR